MNLILPRRCRGKHDDKETFFFQKFIVAHTPWVCRSNSFVGLSLLVVTTASFVMTSTARLVEAHSDSSKGALKILTEDDRTQLKRTWNPFAIVRSIDCARTAH